MINSHKDNSRSDPEAQQRIEALRASMFIRNLNDLKVSLALIQAACAFALEGTSRATASQITERAMSDYDMEATASFTGQVFSSLGITTVTSHGKSRFVLEYEPLEEIRKGISVQCEDLISKLETTLKTFAVLPDRIKALKARWREIARSRERERELINTINEDRKTPSRLDYLEEELRKIQAKEARTKTLEKECQKLSQKIKRLPPLEEKKKSLKSAIKEYETAAGELKGREEEIERQEKALASKETRLADRVEKLQKQKGWLELAELEEAINESKQELDQVLKQLGEKRSLLDKLLMRRKEGDAGR